MLSTVQSDSASGNSERLTEEVKRKLDLQDRGIKHDYVFGVFCVVEMGHIG